MFGNEGSRQRQRIQIDLRAQPARLRKTHRVKQQAVRHVHHGMGNRSQNLAGHKQRDRPSVDIDQGAAGRLIREQLLQARSGIAERPDDPEDVTILAAAAEWDPLARAAARMVTSSGSSGRSAMPLRA